MQTVTLETYGISFDVPAKWLLKNIQEQTLGEFLDNYTWDESEWLYNKFSVAGLELELLQDTLIDFYINEYELCFVEARRDAKEINKKSIVPIAYTTLGDNEELEIQVNLDVAKARLESHVTGKNIEEMEYLQYENLIHASYDIGHADFTDIIRLHELDVDELIEKDKKYQ